MFSISSHMMVCINILFRCYINNNTLCGYIIFCSLVVEHWVVFTFWLLQITLFWIFMYKICEDISSFLFYISRSKSLGLSFRGAARFFSKVTASFYIPTNIGELRFFRILLTLYIVDALVNVTWTLIVVFICISLTTNIKPLFMCLLAIGITSLGKCLFIAFDQFLIWSLSFNIEL